MKALFLGWSKILILIVLGQTVAHARTALRMSCLMNLQQIDSAKEMFVLEKRLTSTNIVLASDISGYIKGGFPKCPGGGVYAIGNVGEDPQCSMPFHSLTSTMEPPSEAGLGVDASKVACVLCSIATVWLGVGWMVNRWRDTRSAAGD